MQSISTVFLLCYTVSCIDTNTDRKLGTKLLSSENLKIRTKYTLS